MKKLFTYIVLVLFVLNQYVLILISTSVVSDNSCTLTKYHVVLPDTVRYLDLTTYQERYESLQEDIKLEEERKAEERRLAIQKAYQANYNNAWYVAYSLVGYRGDCWYIANLFSQRFRGYSINNKYQISYEEAIPGDLIYYADGGLGVQHWATYLGDGMALQGNYNGSAQIKSVWLKGASGISFYRVTV